MTTTLKALAAGAAMTLASLGVAAAPAGAETTTRSEASRTVYVEAPSYATEDPGASQNSVVNTTIALAWCKKVGGELGVAMCGTLVATP